MKNYYSVTEAAEFLSSELSVKLSSFDVMEMAARGEFNLCASFDGNVAEFKYAYPNPIRAGTFLFKLKNALIKIPPESINLRGGIVHIIPIEIIEVVINSDYKAVHPYYGGGCENLPRIQPGYFYGTYASDPENARKIKFAAFETNSDDALISTQDLLNFLNKKQKSEQPKPQPESSISVTGEADENAFEDKLADLFDPVPVTALEKMFPADGQWTRWAEKAARNGLKIARKERAKFNPYRAGRWFISKGLNGWDEARLNRALAKQLPPRSKDSEYLLTGNID